MMTDATFKEDIKLDEKIKKETELPRRYKVIVLNDDQTPMEWVISILTEIFKHTQSKAQELTLAIHRRFITGHDMKGYADHDWRALSRAGEVAAIYMGKRAARFVQGRLLMHGAHPETPITVVENVSRVEQRTLTCRLGTLSDDLETANLTGPALMLLGLAPRAALQVAQDISIQEVAQ